jgi:hypothetical protein
MRDDLMAEEVEVDPFGARASLFASEKRYVERTRIG